MLGSLAFKSAGLMECACMLQELHHWLLATRGTWQTCSNRFRVIYVLITTKKMVETGLRYTLDTNDLLVIPRQTLAAYIPAIADRLTLLNEGFM